MIGAVLSWEAKAGNPHRGCFKTLPSHRFYATGHPPSALLIQRCGRSLLLLLSRLCVGLVVSLQAGGGAAVGHKRKMRSNQAVEVLVHERIGGLLTIGMLDEQESEP